MKNYNTEHKDGLDIEENGSKVWYLNDQYHREGGPAIEWADGTKVWYKHGKCHRIGGPAIMGNDGLNLWYIEAKHYYFEEYVDKLSLNEEEAEWLRIRWNEWNGVPVCKSYDRLHGRA